MKRNLLVFGLAISFAFAFFNSAAFAASFEFQVTPSITSACPCSSLTPQNVQVSVHNLYQYPDTYSFTVDAPPGITAQIQQSLVVNQGDTRSLDLFLINIGCSVIPGDYNVVIKAKSGTTGDVLTKTLNLQVLNCYEVQLGMDSRFREMCIEENASSVFYITLQNAGKYSDTYDLSSSVSWAVFSDDPVTVDAGRSKTVAMALTPPAGTKGIQTIAISVKSQKFYSTDTDTVQLNVQDCYSMTADLQPSEISICLGEVATQKLTISNTGAKADTFFISVPNWVSVDRTSVLIDSKKSADVTITLKPGQKGKTFFNVTAVSVRDPNQKVVIPASVDAQECRGVAVIVTPASAYVCQGVEADFTVAVKNLGMIQDTFNVTSSSGVLEFNKLVLEPKETKEFTFRVANAAPGNYSVSVKAQADGISDDDTVAVVVDNCYSASMDISPQNTSVCAGAAVNYTAAIKNTGKLSDTYTLAVQSPIAGNITRQFTLGPGQVRMEYFTVQAPSDSQANDYAIKVSLYSAHSSAASQSVLTVKPRSSCYSVQITPQAETKLVQICNASAMSVTIKNTGDRRDSYNLSIDGPSWAYISPNLVELAGGQQQVVFIYFSPCFGAETKVYEIGVKAASPFVQSRQNIAIGVVENATTEVTPPAGNQTGGIGGNVTGSLILGLDSNQWKLVAIIIITLIIIIILAARFIMLAKK